IEAWAKVCGHIVKRATVYHRLGFRVQALACSSKRQPIEYSTLEPVLLTTAIEQLHVPANGINFRVAVSGPPDGPAILLLHGSPEGSISWRLLMEALPQARMYAPDLRGYPGTDQPRSGYDVFTLTDDVKALIEALKLDRPLLVTHDWGGAIGWIF